MSDQSWTGELWGELQFGLHRWIVGTGFGERSFSFRFWWFGRRDQAENGRAFSECICSRESFLFQRNVLIALGANESCVSAAIRLPEHIAAHGASATYGNPDCGSFVGSHQRLAGCECGGIIHWNAAAPEWKAANGFGLQFGSAGEDELLTQRHIRWR